MKIRWLGHSSFLIASDTGVKIVTDPYTTGTVDLSYGEIKEPADIVTMSHNHFDHNNVAAVRGATVLKGALAAEIKGIAIKGIPAFHDDAGGRRRGENTIYCFDVDGIRVCHLGDLGHQLDTKQINEIGGVDILLIPVGGTYTIDAKGADQVCRTLAPKVVIPMHYKTPKARIPLATVDEFLREKKNVIRPNSSEAEFKKNTLPAATQILILKSAL